MRSDIFLQVYKSYQEKTIWLDTNKVNLKQMALFGETKENVNLLFECITSNEEHFRRRINAALLFKHFTFKHFTPEERLVMSNHYAQTIYKLSTLDFENRETIEQHLIVGFPFKNDAEAIVEHYRTTNSSQLISSILYLIDAYDLQDKCIDIILGFNTKIQRRQTIGNYHLDTNTCLSKIKEESSFIKFFNSLLNENLYYEYSSYRKDDLKIVVENCKKHSSDELIKSIINLSSKHASWSSSLEWELFSSFFEDENIRDKSIKILLDILSSDIKEEMRLWMYSHTLAKIVKTKDLPTIFKSVDNKDLYLAIIRYSAKESEIYVKVLDHLKSKYNYEPTEEVDPWQKRDQDAFDILFDKERFKKECFTLFDEHGESFVPNILYDEEREDKYWNHSLLAFLTSHVDKGEIERTQLERWFIKKTDIFEDYLNNKISQNLPRKNSNSEMPDITEQQLDVIKEYYNKRIKEISFLLEIDPKRENSYSISQIAPILITYMQSFNFDCPDDKLCEMLGNFNADFDLVISKVSEKSILVETILANLKNYDRFASSRISDMCKYCIDNKIPEALTLILNIIKAPSFDDYQKIVIIQYCIENNVLVEDIVIHSNVLNQSQKLDLCYKLFKENCSYQQEMIKLLDEIIETPESKENKLSAISLLVWMKEEKALRLLIDYGKEHSIIALYDPFNNIHVGRYHMEDTYLLYDDIKVLPLLMEFLELSLQPDITPKNRGNSKIERNIIHLALLSEDNYIEVIMTLEDFMEKNQKIYADIEFLNFTINTINEQYTEKSTKRYTFKDALSELDILF